MTLSPTAASVFGLRCETALTSATELRAHALPLLQRREHPGQRQPSDGGERLHPPPARVRGLRRALHDLRAGAAAGNLRRQALGPARAVRPREAVALGRGGAAQAPHPARAHRAPGVGPGAAAGKHGRAGRSVLGDRRIRDGGLERPRPRCLCTLRLRLPLVPRGGGFPGGAGRDRRQHRARSSAVPRRHHSPAAATDRKH